MAFLDFFKRSAPAQKETRNTGRTSKRSYNAFAGAEVNPLNASWTRSSVPINEQIKRDLATLRARSRDLAKNDVHVKKFIRSIKSNVIGRKGIKLQSKVKNSDGSLDEIAIEAIERAWATFGEWGVANAKGDRTWVELQGLFFDHLLRDGEVLIIKVQSKSVNKFGFGLQYLDPEVLEVQNDQTLKSGNRVRMGIETDGYGVVVAYHVTSLDTTHEHYYTFNGRGYIRLDRSRVIHRFISEYADQLRGVPEIAVAMTRIKNLDGYEQAEIIGKRVSSSKMGFFSRNEEGQGYEGEENDDGSLSMDAQPGVLEELPNNVNFQTFDTKHDGASYDQFVKSCLRGISAGLGISYHTLANDLEGVNYSSARVGVIEDRDIFMGLQDWLIECFIKTVFNDWLEMAVLSGAVKTSKGGTLRVSDIERYKQASWQGRRWLWVDPLKDMSANEKAITLGLTSRSAIIREQGYDPDEVFKEIADEQEKLKKLGIYQEPAQAAGFLMPENGVDPNAE